MTPETDTTDLQRAEARLPRVMAALGAVGTLAFLLAARPRFAAAFALGAALALLNYLWLHHIVEALVNAGRVRPSKAALAKVVVRYPLMFAALYVFYKTGWLPFTAVLAGLFVPVAAVILEALLLLRHSIADKGDGAREERTDT